MTSINMISEEEATGKVKEIYDEIMSQLGVDFVPNLYKTMAVNPEYLEANWNKVRTVMTKEGRLDRLTKEIIAVAVSAVNGCDYCLWVHTAAAKKQGLDDVGVLELMAVVVVAAAHAKRLYFALGEDGMGMESKGRVSKRKIRVGEDSCFSDYFLYL